MGFFVFGINYRSCPVEVRERLCFNAEQLRSALTASRTLPGLSELVILSTCNRVEFYGVHEASAVPSEPLFSLIEETLDIDRTAFSSFIEIREGKEAIRYVFRVAAGLESMVVGENEILGQIRDAFRTSNEAGTVHSLLYRLMEKALKVGKDVRGQTRINEGAVSIPSVAVELAEKIFGRLSGEKVMVLGTGQMSLLTLRNLRDAGATISYIVSRDPVQGEKAAAEFDAQWLSLSEEWYERLSEVDILISSTASQEPVVLHTHVEQAAGKRRGRPLFLIDIAVPRDIESSINRLDDVYLYNIDDLKGVADSNLTLRKKEVHEAEKLADEAVAAYAGWLEQLKARPTMESFETFLDDVLDKELSRGLQNTVDENLRKEIKERIRSRLMHAPIQKIKEASANGGVKRYLEALHSLFALDDRPAGGKEKGRDPKKNTDKNVKP